MLTEAIKHQFNKAFDMLAAAIPSFSTQQWCCRVGNDKAPGQLVLHTLACAEFYTCDDLSVHLRFVQPWTQMPDEELPSQEALAAYLAEVRSKTTTWIDSIGDQGLTGLAVPYAPNQEVSHLERLLYALRHLAHHTGELCVYQKLCGLPAAHWK